MKRERKLIDLPTNQTAAYVRHVRSKLQLTQAELATLCGVQVWAVTKWEGGHHRPSLRHWRRLHELVETAHARS